MAENEHADEGSNSKRKAAQADKSQSRWNTLIFLLIPLLGVLLPRSYRGFVPFLFLIPLVISLVNRFRGTGEMSGNSTPITTYPTPNQDHPGEPYLHTPKDPKDPRGYKPIG